MFARLIEVRGRTIFELETERVVIGRRRTCEVVLEHPGVSARHCELARSSEGQWTITDLGSTNGTFVNGLPITETTLRFGDEIGLGKHCRYRFEMPHRGSIGEGPEFA
jgi:pSer/pThr/pTyr-binding forkhead associated (FHA) protein